ncbi:HMCN [Mytilus edulis]|uniref:HMCN n=1 Tax=Mytilus edulis TaxID=6550 RepID=A0A8S3QHP4_MYTED|nr:HMCN [Mytilus edulis]
MDESGKWGRSDYQFTFRKIHRGNADVLSLTVIDFNEEDDGIYVCKATNEAGEALSNKAILKYIDFNEEDDGIYVCKATNEAGEALSNKAILKYIEPPTATVSPDRQNVVNENISATEAFTLAETQVKYNFPVSVTLRHQLKVKLPDNESQITDCIKIGQTLVFADCYGSQLITCNADGTDQRHIPLHRKPWHITEIDSDTVAVSCSGKSIGIINISTDEVTSTINTRKYCRAIAYDDNNLYVVIGEGIINVIDQAVKGKMLVCIYETSIYCCSMHGKLIWKFENEMYQSLYSVTTDDKDNVYVSDFMSNAVLVVSGEGKQYRELLTKSDGLNGAV